MRGQPQPRFCVAMRLRLPSVVLLAFLSGVLSPFVVNAYGYGEATYYGQGTYYGYGQGTYYGYGQGTYVPDVVTTITSTVLASPPNTLQFQGIMTNAAAVMNITNSIGFARVGKLDAISGEKTYSSMVVVANFNGSGKDYVFVGSTDIGAAFEVFDVSNPLAPIRKAGITWPSGSASYGVKKLVVSGTKAYVVRNNPSGVGTLEVINITTPASPTILTTANLPCPNPTALAVSGTVAYVGSTCGIATGYFSIYDLTQTPPNKLSDATLPGGTLLADSGIKNATLASNSTTLPSANMVASAITAFNSVMCFFGILCR